jgi:hypothetical protein
VNVFIGRDGAEIGEFPRAQLEPRARAGELQPTDYYWHEGMENWLPLGDLLGADAWKPLATAPPATATPPATGTPPATAAPPETAAPPPPPLYRRLAVPAAICGVGFAAFACAIYFVISDSGGDESPDATASRFVSPAPEQATDIQVRDRAVADLQQKLSRLPQRAEPPLNTFYYDVAVEMNQSFSKRVPWSAVIRGRENIVDPATEKTVLSTDFSLRADYRDGEWIYTDYRASTSDMIESVSTEIQHQGLDPAPPSLVGMLGLKTAEP